MSYKDGKLLYHLTSVSNLESIISLGLLSRNNVKYFDDVADQEIIDFRRENNLNDLVPFHFFAKNPFDGRVMKDNPHKEFIYICIHRDFAKANNFKIIPKHPKSMETLKLYDYREGIEIIDWNTMDIRDYVGNNYCKQVCMAECLSEKTINPVNFFSFFVKTELTEKHLLSLHKRILKWEPFRVNVRPNMF